MNVIDREDMISVNGNMIRVDEVVGQLKHLPSTEVKTFFDSIQKTVPRKVRMGALRNALNDQIDDATILGSLSDEVNYRLKWYDDFSEYQLEKLVTILDNEFVIDLFRKELWLSFLKLHEELKFGEKEISDLYNLSEIYISEPKEKFMEYNRFLDTIFYDYDDHVDGLPFDQFRDTLKQSSTLIELREIGVKYDVDVPRRIKKSELIDIILDEMTIAGTLTADVEQRIKRMSIMTLQRFAKDNKIKASVELKKEDIIEYIITRAENEIAKTSVDLKVLKADEAPKHKPKRKETPKKKTKEEDSFRKEIDELNSKIATLMESQEQLLSGKNTKLNKEKKAALESEIEENIQEKSRLEEGIESSDSEAKKDSEELKGLIDETIINENDVFIINENELEETNEEEMPGLVTSNDDEPEEVIEEISEEVIEEISEEVTEKTSEDDSSDEIGLSAMMENMSVEDIENMSLTDDIPYVMDGNDSIDDMDLSNMLDDMMTGEGLEAPSVDQEEITFEEDEEKAKAVVEEEEEHDEELSDIFANLEFTEGEVMTSDKPKKADKKKEITEEKADEVEEEISEEIESVDSKETSKSEDELPSFLDEALESDSTFDEMLVKEIEENGEETASELDDPILTPIFDNSVLEETLFVSDKEETEKKSSITNNFDEDSVEEEPFMEEFFSTSAYDELVEIEKQKSNKQFDIDLYDGVSDGDVVDKHDSDFEAPTFEAPGLLNVDIPANDFEAPEYQSNHEEGAPIFESPSFETPIFEAPVFEAPNFEAQESETKKTKTKQQLRAEVKRLESGSKMEKKRRQSEEKVLMDALRSTSSLGRRKGPIRRVITTTFIISVVIGLAFSIFMLLGFFGKLGTSGTTWDLYFDIKEGMKVFVKETLGLESLRDIYHSIRDFLDNYR